MKIEKKIGKVCGNERRINSLSNESKIILKNEKLSFLRLQISRCPDNGKMCVFMSGTRRDNDKKGFAPSFDRSKV